MLFNLEIKTFIKLQSDSNNAFLYICFIRILTGSTLRLLKENLFIMIP